MVIQQELHKGLSVIKYVYKLTMDACSAFYIGVTNNPTSRLASHKCELKYGKHGSHMFQKAWDESGSVNLYMEILEEAPAEEAMIKEVEHLKSNASNQDLKNTCVNSAKGVPFDRLEDPEGTRLKMSKQSSGENNPMYGKTHTPEAREKISAMLKGKRLGVKIGPMSEENKRKLSEARLKDPPVGEKNPFFGKKHTPESLEKMRSWDRNKSNMTFVKPVEVDGVAFKSRADAARALNIPQALMTHRLKHPERYPTYKSLDADK